MAAVPYVLDAPITIITSADHEHYLRFYTAPGISPSKRSFILVNWEGKHFEPLEVSLPHNPSGHVACDQDNDGGGLIHGSSKVRLRKNIRFT